MSSPVTDPPDDRSVEPAFSDAVAMIAEGAAALDRKPRFPGEAFDSLDSAGVLALPASEQLEVATEWRVLRAVAGADASVGRILDGHLNAVARIAQAADEPLRTRELERVRSGGRLLGLWGADPLPGEGVAATLEGSPKAPAISGVKTFCSGAGGVDAALVLAREPDGGPPLLCLADIDATVEVDPTWFHPGGLRASESHRVSFLHTPVAVLGKPGELSREPYFSQDALRTSVTWAGMADAASASALAFLAGNRAGEELARLAAGRIEAGRATIDLWLGHALRAVEQGAPLAELAVWLRAEVIRAAREILDAAATACGSWPFATGSALDRARRDLELFTLQHRIDPLLARRGAAVLGGGGA